MLRTAGKILLIGFLLWHMFSVGAYVIPRGTKDPVSQYIVRHIVPHVTKYMLLTSQWQQWNIFGPEPLRRTTSYRVEANTNGNWRELTTIQVGTFSVWRHATRFKLYGSMFDPSRSDRNKMGKRFLTLICDEYHIAPKTPVRLQFVTFDVPYHTKLASSDWWKHWQPHARMELGTDITCPEQ